MTKKIFGTADKDFDGSLGYCLYDRRNEEYHVLLQDCGGNCDNAYILNLFHELSHVETLPYRVGASLICSSKKKEDTAIIGYEFWKEYIAQYEAVNRYQMLIGDIMFLKDKDAARQVIENLRQSWGFLLYEIILYSEITGVYLEEIEEETKNLVACLKKIRSSFTSKEEMKGITKKDLTKIGKCVEKIFDLLEERK